MTAAEFIYTKLLKPPPLKYLANKIILFLLPKSVNVGGATVVLNKQDPVVSGALTFRIYERNEIAFFKRILEPGQTMLDIGANVGLYTALAGKIIGPAGRIMSFEPDLQSLKYLKETVSKNNLDFAEVINAAASDQWGSARLHVSNSNRGDNRLYANELSDESFEVETVRVDDLLMDRGIASVDVIKIDVQGFEGQVISGMEKTLKESQNLRMLMEFWPKGLEDAGSDSEQLLIKLESLGLRVYELKSKGDFVRILNKREFIERFPDRAYTNLVVLGSGVELDTSSRS